MNPLLSYIPIDRRLAMFNNQSLAEQMQGAALFADISGYTPLTRAMVKHFGPKKGVDKLTHQINNIFEAIISQIHNYGGSVISFGGDAITCWFDNDDGLRAVAAGLDIQQAMQIFKEIIISDEVTINITVKVGIATGTVKRIQIGEPTIQYIDVIAGKTLDKMANSEKHAQAGEVVIDPDTFLAIGSALQISEKRFKTDTETETPFAVVVALLNALNTPPTPWPTDINLNTSPMQKLAKHWLLPPLYAQLQLGGDYFLADIRSIVVLFIKFSGLNYDQDPQVAQKLDLYIQWMQTTLLHYGGYLLKLNVGDKGNYCMATFGTPISHGDDENRAVAAALALQDPPSSLSFISKVQIGISQGQMVAGPMGSPTRYFYDLLGDEANMAARLMSNATPGQILLSQHIADTLKDSYELQDLGLITVKGKNKPIHVFSVHGKKQTPHRKTAPLFKTSFVGRNNELTFLNEMLADIITSKGQILHVQGALGMGKSHLIAEFIQQFQHKNLDIVIGNSQSLTQNTLYHPWQQIFYTLLALTQPPQKEFDDDSWLKQQITHLQQMLQAVNPEWLLRLPLLGDLLDLPIPDNNTTAGFDSELRQMALISLALDIILHKAKQTPLLIVLDDIHWMDEASQELTLYLSYALNQAPIFLILVSHPQQEAKQPQLWTNIKPLAYFTALNLSYLSKVETEILIKNLLSGQPPALLVDLIYAKTGGVPFYIKEWLNTLHQKNHLHLQEDGRWCLDELIITMLNKANCLVKDKTDGQWRLQANAPLDQVNLDLPTTIQGFIISRFDHLALPLQLVLKLLCVAGTHFEFELLAHLYPVQADDNTLQLYLNELEKFDFIRLLTTQPRLTYAFKQDIIQEVIYNSLLEKQSQDLHQQLAHTLEQLFPDAIERMAHHYYEGQLQDKALIYLEKAAIKAQHEYANETALTYYTKVLSLEDRWQWRQEQIKLWHLVGNREQEKLALETFSSIDTVPEFIKNYLWGQFYESIGKYQMAQTKFEQAKQAYYTAKNTFGEAKCLMQLGLIARRIGDYKTAKTTYKQSLSLLQTADTDNIIQTLIDALNGLATIFRQLGQYKSAKTHYQKALTLSNKINSLKHKATTLNGLGGTAYIQRQLDEAQVYHQQTLELWRTLGHKAGEGTSLTNLSLVATDLGHYGQALHYLTEALAIQQNIGNRWEESNVYNSFGILYYKLGQLALARDNLEKGLAISTKIGDEAGQAYILANLGPVYGAKKDFEKAKTLLNKGLLIGKKQGDKHMISYFLSHLGLVHLQLKEFNHVFNYATQALVMRKEINLELWTTADLSILATTHQALNAPQKALAYATEALKILTDCGGEGPDTPHQDYFMCYQVFKALNKPKQATIALKAAKALVTAQAEKITAPDLRRSFLENVPINREIMNS